MATVELTTMKTILDEVTLELSLSGPKLLASVKAYYVDKEVKARSAMLLAAFDERKRLNSEINKIEKNPAIKNFELEGHKVAQTSYTEEQSKQHRELKEKLDKLDKTLTLCLNEGKPEQWQELNKAISKAPQPGKEESPMGC